MRWPRDFDALRERPFRLLFIAHSASMVGDGFARVALVFAVLEVTDSPAAVGVVLAAQSLPMVVLLLAGGVVGDRRSRRSIMVAADLVRLVTQGAMAAALVTGVAEVWHLAALAALHGAATAFFNPAASALVPQTVTAPRLHQANALRGLAQAAGSLLGPGLAGIVVAAAGAGWALAIDSATFAFSAMVLLRIPRAAVARLSDGGSFRADLREGWNEFAARDWVWGIVIGAAFANALLGALWVLGPIVAAESLGGPAAWGLIVSALGGGSVLGGALILRLRPERPLVVAVAAGSLPVIPLVLVAMTAPLWAIVVAMLAAGAGLMVFNTLWETSLQRHVPQESLSRVSAYDWFGSLALDPLGRGLAGPVAAVVGVSTTLWGAAAAFAVVVLAQLSIPGVRRLRDLPTEPAAPV